MVFHDFLKGIEAMVTILTIVTIKIKNNSYLASALLKTLGMRLSERLLVADGFDGVEVGGLLGRDVAEDDADDCADHEAEDDRPERYGGREVENCGGEC